MNNAKTKLHTALMNILNAKYNGCYCNRASEIASKNNLPYVASSNFHSLNATSLAILIDAVGGDVDKILAE